MIGRFLALVLVLAMTACGGGGSDATPPAPPAPPTQPTQPPACTPKVVRIGLYGDSTQVGITPVLNAPAIVNFNNPRDVIQRAMDARFGAGSVVVDLRALSGTRLSEIVAGGINQIGYYEAWPGSVDEDIAVENFGINDAGNGATAADFEAQLRRMIALHPVVLETPLPFAGTDGFAQVVRNVAASTGAPLVDVNAYVDALPSWSSYVSADGIHPTDAGYELVTSHVVVPALVPMVSALRCGQ